MNGQWLGLHNPQWHETTSTSVDWAWCDTCRDSCKPWRPCYCCLAAEVEALRAQVQRVRGVPKRPALTVPRVSPYFDRGWSACLRAVHAALDGGDE